MSFLGHLEKYGDYPVPFIVKWIDGKPDFRVVDMEKWDQCVDNGLCSICGYKLGEYGFIVGGPLTGKNYYFFDPPMHHKCANYSAEVCPYISGKDRKFSDRAVAIPVDSLDHIQPRNVDGDLFIYTVRVAQIRKVVIDGSLLLQARRMLGKKRVVPENPEREDKPPCK